jgi:hypothetical protein
MSQFIDIKSPLTLEAGTDCDLGYFEPNFWISELNAVAISPQGVAFKYGLLLPGSLPPRRRSTLLLALYAYKQKFTLERRMLPRDKRYILGFNPYSSGNYYHWITEALPKLWFNKNSFREEDVVLVPDSGITSVAKSSLSAIGFLRHDVIAKGCIAHASRLVLSQSSARQAEYHSSLLEMRDAVHATLGIKYSQSIRGDLVYIPRGNGSVRSVENETQVIESLVSEFGFIVIEPHRLTFEEQVIAFSRARFIISIHGAALTNILWMQPGSSVIELYKSLDTPLGNVHTPPGLPSLCYLRLASLIGANYDLFECEAVDSSVPVRNARLTIDIKLLCSLVSKKLSCQPYL